VCWLTNWVNVSGVTEHNIHIYWRKFSKCTKQNLSASAPNGSLHLSSVSVLGPSQTRCFNWHRPSIIDTFVTPKIKRPGTETDHYCLSSSVWRCISIPSRTFYRRDGSYSRARPLQAAVYTSLLPWTQHSYTNHQTVTKIQKTEIKICSEVTILFCDYLKTRELKRSTKHERDKNCIRSFGLRNWRKKFARKT
jgi:hypothetical protein